MDKWETLGIAVLVVCILGAGYFLFKPEVSGFVVAENGFLVGDTVVSKVIDGDTLIAEGQSVRLLGIDTDEKGYDCYFEAKERLEELVLGKEVVFEKAGEDKDMYDRYLRFIFVNGKNVNLKLVQEGLAVARVSENGKYKDEIVEAEKNAIKNKIGCKWGANELVNKVEKEEKWSKPTDSNVVNACDAGKYVGQEKIVEGKIVGTYKYKDKMIFLNFEKPYPNSCFTVVIWSSDWHKFPENAEKYYEGKTVRITGYIKEYDGKAEITLKDLSQIEVS